MISLLLTLFSARRLGHRRCCRVRPQIVQICARVVAFGSGTSSGGAARLGRSSAVVIPAAAGPGAFHPARRQAGSTHGADRCLRAGGQPGCRARGPPTGHAGPSWRPRPALPASARRSVSISLRPRMADAESAAARRDEPSALPDVRRRKRRPARRCAHHAQRYAG